MKSGDNASAIAQAHGITLAELKALNPGKDLDNLLVGFFHRFLLKVTELCWEKRGEKKLASASGFEKEFSLK